MPIQTRTVANFVDGSYVETGNTFDVHYPVTGQVAAHVHEADAALVDRAVAAARAALDGLWGRLTADERIDLVIGVADGIAQRFDEFVEAEVTDTGQAYNMAKRVNIPRGAANFRAFAHTLRENATEAFRMETPDGQGALNFGVRHPRGVIGVISPWNAPMLLMTWKVGPALAFGNTVVVKPSEVTPSTAALLGQVMNDVGVPAGVYNVVHGGGKVGEMLTTHRGVDGITFTGETVTGSRILQAVAPTLKATSMEMGGKNPGIVFEDADLDLATTILGRSIFLNTGQVCLGTERVYVHESVFEEMKDRLVAYAEGLKPGYPDEEGVTLGPVVSDEHRDKIVGYYQVARDEGAEVLVGGGVPHFGDERDNGSWVEPTLWAGLAHDARTCREEIFGPCAALIPFSEEDEVIRMANDTDYGLSATFFTTDVSRALRVAPRLQAGIIWVNDWFLRDLRTAFGGMKHSGIGREGGVHGLEFYTETSNVCIKI
ncbi:aminomuconate-semialdehyde/2-hydroxymuconate-6-semialdehyde dehydrogenase [Raineyella antarctica]|uniref:Aminomuconate-semialdehyde/2-hydroxymuconate-6-semialdehyde dehydrogenase n=1 Tax=Raineyella antarctica TaxID=1577474 RepID=A0A1G6GHY9_9ACTN|nr:2-hydroxymuconic semialdehyde dehydrogenase [Raineyella antarctica]SDB81617.1 aminomuconate-semialdehyde/2-hydroxymuconate-6-semialdehyde dehydrogenase [Raineyella antarctica]